MKTFDSVIQEPLSGIAKNIANSGSGDTQMKITPSRKEVLQKLYLYITML